MSKKPIYDEIYSYDNGVLKNKLEITNENELFLIEGALSMKAMRNNIDHFRKIDPFSKESIFEIHKILFQEVYEWAGKERVVGISKGNTLFCLPKLIQTNLNEIFSVKPDSFKDICKMYMDLNMVHPFREGNGRTGRVWLNQAIETLLGKHIDFSKISQTEYMNLMIDDNLDKLTDVFSNSLIDVSGLDELHYEKLFMHNAKVSYEYEGYVFENKFQDVIITNPWDLI